jgi:hypothetical protein
MNLVVKATTKQRHKGIHDAYSTVIKELGCEAKFRAKKWLYDEVANRTGYSTGYVSHVITEDLQPTNGERSSK